MELMKDALLQVVKATRMTIAIADSMKGILTTKSGWTLADEAEGLLSDVLFKLCGETLRPWEDFENDSATMKLLRSNKTDEEVTNAFLLLYRANSHCPQPKPNTIDWNMFKDLYKTNGGYMPPEGDLK